MLTLLALAGCGGGGGGGGGGGAAAPRPWELNAINAGVAFDNVELVKGQGAAPGAGVTIGFVDSGIDTQHPAFRGATVDEEFVDGTPDETGTDEESHGTAVASVAHGVARGADLAMFAIRTGSSGGDYIPISLTGLAGRDDDWATIFNTVLGWRDGARKVDILNLSVGHPGIIDSYSEQDLRSNLATAIAAMAQTGVTDKTIFVWAAGNAHNRPCDAADLTQCVNDKVNAVSVQVMPGLAARIAELRGHTVAVVALRQADPANGIAESIASFSNRCGIAADYCIAAPGQSVRGAYFGPHPNAPATVLRGYRGFSGTSVAAPMVAGGLALMRQLFRDQLANTELVARLFDTANNRGLYSNRAIYGRGKMDLGAATSPVGVLSLTPPGQTGNTNALLQTTRFQSGTPLGDGFTRSLASTEIMALDDLGAPFWFRLGAFAPAAPAPPVSARLKGFLAPAPLWESPMAGTRLAAGRNGVRRRAAPEWLQVGFLEPPAQTGGGHLALARGAFTTAFAGRKGLAAAAFTTRGTSTQTPSTGATLMWRPADSPLGVQAGWLGEPRTVLGSVGKGAFGTVGGNTVFVSMEGRVEAGRWRVGANAEWGVVQPEAGGGIIARMSPLSTSAFALHATRAPADWGAVRLSVAQPLRVERGRARLVLPAARTKAGAVVYRSVRADLAPGGRQVDVAGQWSPPLGGGELRLGGTWSYRPAHAKGAHAEVTVMAGWRRGF